MHLLFLFSFASAAVGDGMIHTKGVAARVFSALAAANVNVLAIAQGSSERNISVVLSTKDGDAALRAVHDAFFVQVKKRLAVGIVGLGGVGAAFGRQILHVQSRLKAKYSIEIQLVAVARSSKMILDEKLSEQATSDSSVWNSSTATLPTNLQEFAAFLEAQRCPAVIVDASASSAAPELYNNWLGRGFHIIAANKRFFSGDLAQFKKMQNRTGGPFCLFESTVGAGLPILSSLSDMIESGDEVEEISGVFSGTLSFIFNTLRTTDATFSQIVAKAKSLGYTEPDPRDDLSGLDFARKVVILARLTGLDVGLSDIKLESLVPKALESVTVEEYLNRLGESDADIGKRQRAAAELGQTLAYIGKVDVPNKIISLSLQSVPTTSPIGSLTGADNIVSIKTKRYSSPMVIRGFGAGVDVTAAGMFANLLTVVKSL